MPLTPLLLVHICGAVVGLLSGYLAMLVRKGSGLHEAAGRVYVVSMLTMSGPAPGSPRSSIRCASTSWPPS